MGIDRVALVENLMGPIDPEAKPTQSLFFEPTSPYYKPNFSSLDYDPAGAYRAARTEWLRARRRYGVRVRRGAAGIGYLSTSGNERRELTFEIVQSFLAEVGIKVNADFAPAAIQFGTRLPEGDFQIISHGGPYNDAKEILTVYGCDSPTNTTGYCNPEADKLANQALQTPDAAARAELMNQYEAIIAKDVALIPYFGLPRHGGLQLQARRRLQCQPGAGWQRVDRRLVLELELARVPPGAVTPPPQPRVPAAQARRDVSTPDASLIHAVCVPASRVQPRGAVRRDHHHLFGISAIGDPLGEIRSQPGISQEALQRLIDKKHLDDPLIIQYGYWLRDLLFNQFGTDLLFDRPIWPD